MRREKAPAPDSRADLMGLMQECGSNYKAQFEGRGIFSPFDISRMFRCLKEVGRTLDDGRRAPLLKRR